MPCTPTTSAIRTRSVAVSDDAPVLRMLEPDQRGRLLVSFCSLASFSGFFFRALYSFGFGLGFLRVVALCRHGSQASFANEDRDAFGHLCAVFDPMGDALAVELDAVSVFAGQHRVVGAYFFQEATIAGVAAVRNHDVVVGLFLCACARESDFQHCLYLQFLIRLRCLDPSVRCNHVPRGGIRENLISCSCRRRPKGCYRPSGSRGCRTGWRPDRRPSGLAYSWPFLRIRPFGRRRTNRPCCASCLCRPVSACASSWSACLETVSAGG